MARPEISPWLTPLLQNPGWRRDDETSRAVREGLAAIGQRDWRAAADWIAYAQRRIRNDATLTFALAELHFQCGNKQAAGMYEFLAERTDWPEAWWRLALCHHAEARGEQARAALHRRLSQAAPPQQADFAALADGIAGDRGWFGLDNAGRIATSARGRVRLALDGASLRGRKLGADWHKAAHLTAEAGGVPLIGSPVDIKRITRVEGFVRADAGEISGWCWFPGEPERVPVVSLAGQPVEARAFLATRDPEQPFATPRRFAAVVDRGIRQLDAIGPHGRRLMGAPLMPWLELDGAQAAASLTARQFALPGIEQGPLAVPGFVPIPADLRVPVVAAPPTDQARRVLVVIPVYAGLQITLDCLANVRAARSGIEDILVIADGSPDRALVARLRALAAGDGFAFEEIAENRGFVATANHGLRAAAGRDVVLLNNDTLVPADWLASLRAAVYSADAIGTATPLSNNATIFSYPSLDGTGAVEDAADHAALAARINQGVTVDVPTGHGFCLYIRWECLAQTGLLRQDIFAQGYGEENDFSLRARALGWRHVAAAGCVVAHHESVSFGGAKKHLLQRNLEILNRLHPGYDGLIEAWVKQDPLLPVRRALDLARLERDLAGKDAVLLVTHQRGGGVARHVRDRAAALRAQGVAPLVLRPDEEGGIVLDDNGRYPNLRFDAARELPKLLGLLHASRVKHAEIHHFIGHDPALIAAIAAEFAYDVVLHDFAWYCPRVTLTRADHRYCGEPDLPACDDCIADLGGEIEEEIAPSALHPRSAALLAGAQRILAPSADTARRYARRFGVQPVVQPWEDDSAPLKIRPARGGGSIRRLLVAGAVSHQKGYELLLALARLVKAKSLPLEIILVGYSIDDARLLATGVVRITGEYREEDLVSVIQAQDADFAFLPSQWPETWSYVLSRIWEAGLPVVALDLGAPAERIKARGGKLVPPHLPLERLAALMLDPGWV